MTPPEQQALESAAAAWAEFYTWAMEQPREHGARQRIYSGPVADTILSAAGVSFTRDPVAYKAAVDEVIRRGYELAGGKKDLRGCTLEGDGAKLAKRAKKMRAGGDSLRVIAARLHVSVSTVYKLTRDVSAEQKGAA